MSTQETRPDVVEAARRWLREQRRGREIFDVPRVGPGEPHVHNLLAHIEAQGRAIIVWPFYEAPKHLRDMSRHGGDEDWIALIPAGSGVPFWAEEGGRFACCSTEEYTLDDGRTVVIGAHA